VNVVSQLFEDDIAVLVPIDEQGRTRLLEAEPYLVAQTISIRTYPGSPSVESVGVDAVWVIYAMVRPLRARQSWINRNATHGLRFLQAPNRRTAPALAAPSGRGTFLFREGHRRGSSLEDACSLRVQRRQWLMFADYFFR
jgi:hypothetical protein